MLSRGWTTGRLEALASRLFIKYVLSNRSRRLPGRRGSFCKHVMKDCKAEPDQSPAASAVAAHQHGKGWGSLRSEGAKATAELGHCAAGNVHGHCRAIMAPRLDVWWSGKACWDDLRRLHRPWFMLPGNVLISSAVPGERSPCRGR